MKPRKRLPRAGALALSIVSMFILAACSRTVPVAEPSSSPSAPVDAHPITVFGAAAGGANEVEHYKNLAEAVNDAGNVTLRGAATNVRVTRVLVGDSKTDRLLMIGATLHPTEVLAGKPPLSDVTVEFVGPTNSGAGPGEGDDAVAAYKNVLDELSSAIWIVLNKGGDEADYDRLASSQCLFAALPDGNVFNPSYPNGSDPDEMVQQAEGYKSLDALGDALTAAYKG